ncbi:hypothetical protein [Paenibacillus sp. USHLN196]
MKQKEALVEAKQEFEIEWVRPKSIPHFDDNEYMDWYMLNQNETTN